MKDWDFRYDLLPLKDKLFRVAYRITLHTAEAEDITQDTLIRVWNKRHELEDVRSLEAYCLTVCRNLANDRRELHEAQNLSLDGTPCDAPDNADKVDSRMERDERLQWVHRLMAKLPEKQRTILHLRDIEGHSYHEIADILGVSEEQVKVNLFRARRWIKEQYEKIENYGL
ncbi:MAG: RNA polymerase sigma factor [Bacteroidaceae bacterium]|nr:RNA polymerase sigma factor [Bacteroidaceae bacterium]